MLIVYKFNFELSIIRISLVLKWGEEVYNVVFGTHFKSATRFLRIIILCIRQLHLELTEFNRHK
jgi:hypothetical protein